MPYLCIFSRITKKQYGKIKLGSSSINQKSSVKNIAQFFISDLSTTSISVKQTEKEWTLRSAHWLALFTTCFWRHLTIFFPTPSTFHFANVNLDSSYLPPAHACWNNIFKAQHPYTNILFELGKCEIYDKPMEKNKTKKKTPAKE